ncbi:MAG: hypothetical protein ACLPRE_04180 [Limisphaerales bacterium]
MLPDEIADAELAKRANDILDANEIRDCRVVIGRYRKGNNIVHEARLIGGSSASRLKAKSLLPDITFRD